MKNNEKKLWLLLQLVETGKQFIKYFECEYDMDKFKRKLRYSSKIMLVEDSRDIYYGMVD